MQLALSSRIDSNKKHFKLPPSAIFSISMGSYPRCLTSYGAGSLLPCGGVDWYPPLVFSHFSHFNFVRAASTFYIVSVSISQTFSNPQAISTFACRVLVSVVEVALSFALSHCSLINHSHNLRIGLVAIHGDEARVLVCFVRS